MMPWAGTRLRPDRYMPPLYDPEQASPPEDARFISGIAMRRIERNSTKEPAVYTD